MFGRTLTFKKSSEYIFDEATSYLVISTENKIMKNIPTTIKDRTSMIIAHRLSTVINANKILGFNLGVIEERDTHVSLLKLQEDICIPVEGSVKCN